jgi:hypothetical protein
MNILGKGGVGSIGINLLKKLPKKGINIKRLSYATSFTRSIPCLRFMSGDIWNSNIK